MHAPVVSTQSMCGTGTPAASMQRIILNSLRGTRREPVMRSSDSSLSSTLETGWRNSTQRSACDSRAAVQTTSKKNASRDAPPAIIRRLLTLTSWASGISPARNASSATVNRSCSSSDSGVIERLSGLARSGTGGLASRSRHSIRPSRSSTARSAARRSALSPSTAGRSSASIASTSTTLRRACCAANASAEPGRPSSSRGSPASVGRPMAVNVARMSSLSAAVCWAATPHSTPMRSRIIRISTSRSATGESASSGSRTCSAVRETPSSSSATDGLVNMSTPS